VDFALWSDSSTLDNAFALSVYAYQDADRGYKKLGEARATHVFASLGNGSVPGVRFVFAGGLEAPVAEGHGPLPVVLQVTQLSGVTLSMGANLVSNPRTPQCPVEAAGSIPMQIYVQ
jgi:hypothetical protein